LPGAAAFLNQQETRSEGGAAMTGMFERWKDLRIGEPIDQPVIFALLVIAIAITLYLFA
jgi:hypothetical protein